VIRRRTFIQSIAATASIGLPEARAATPRSNFGTYSTAEEVTRGLDLSGKVAVVTGATAGIGFETMRVLALRGAHVIGTGRTVERAKEACGRVKGKTTPVALELTDFASAAACADTIQKLGLPIDMLVLNAGIYLGGHEQVNGLEKQFVVNHLGHFVLTHRLLNRVTAAPQSRVVVVGSGSHFSAPRDGIQFGDLSGKSWSNLAYGHSKLANGLFSLELASRLRGTRATSNCLTPGQVVTEIFRNLSTQRADAMNRGRDRTPEHGAATPCYVATNPTLDKVSGEYFSDCNPAPQSAHQTDKAMAAKLWDVSTDLTREYLG
jgi:NAD(P)-dependent dehydrogenase (short-subunit alcohol dehydrogenase family)